MLRSLREIDQALKLVEFDASSASRPTQLADIFLGKASHFPDGTPATPIDLSEESPVREKFWPRRPRPRS